MVRFINIALENLNDHPGQTPKAIVVDIGELTGILPEYLLKYYPAASKGTCLSDAELIINEIPSEAECLSCGNHYHPSRETDYRCPECGGIKCRFLHGREAAVNRLIL